MDKRVPLLIISCLFVAFQSFYPNFSFFFSFLKKANHFIYFYFVCVCASMYTVGGLQTEHVWIFRHLPLFWGWVGGDGILVNLELHQVR